MSAQFSAFHSHCTHLYSATEYELVQRRTRWVNKNVRKIRHSQIKHAAVDEITVSEVGQYSCVYTALINVFV